MKTQAGYNRQNLAYRDADYSPAQGVSLWESCPQLAALDPGTAFIFLDDFFQYKQVSTDESGYIATIVQAGAGDAAITSTDLAGGVLKIVNDAADDDSVELQWNAENFKAVANKPLWFETRVKVSDATQSDLTIGLCITDTSLITAMSDGIYFRKNDGDAKILTLTEKNATETQTDTGLTMADDTWVKLGFFWDGSASVFFYVDGVLKATHTTNIVDDEELAVSIAFRNGEAVAKTAYVDYVKCCQVR
jgi:hypothetical protein